MNNLGNRSVGMWFDRNLYCETERYAAFLQIIEELLKFMTEEILRSCSADIEFIQKRSAADNGQPV